MRHGRSRIAEPDTTDTTTTIAGATTDGTRPRRPPATYRWRPRRHGRTGGPATPSPARRTPAPRPRIDDTSAARRHDHHGCQRRDHHDVADDTSNILPDRATRVDRAIVKARGGSICKVGPAGGTGEVFQDDATARILSGSGWGVTVSLRGGANGADLWNALAAECFNATATCPTRQLAIELDGEIISAPTVQTDNFGTSVQITGSFSESEARNLARVLNSGSLPVKLETQAVQTVSPTLGKDSLHAAVDRRHRRCRSGAALHGAVLPPARPDRGRRLVGLRRVDLDR